MFIDRCLLHTGTLTDAQRHQGEVGPPYGPEGGLIWAVLGSVCAATGANLGELDGGGGRLFFWRGSVVLPLPSCLIKKLQ